MENKNQQEVIDVLDILWELDLLSEKKDVNNAENIWFLQEIEEENSSILINENEEIKPIENKIKNSILFMFKYVLTSSLIFWVLLLTTNYSAYTNIAKSYLFQDEMNRDNAMIMNSVQASYVQEKTDLTQTWDLIDDSKDNKIPFHSIKSLIKNKDKEDVNLKIDINPYENRIVIPKIWKNVPLVEIQNKSVSWEKELNNIFMNELENGVVRYPWSVKPWKEWNTFVFGHSSNFPWIKWDYNDVFALLDNVNFDDEVIVYYGQKKFKYKIREKKVISPWNVSVLKRDKGKSEITLMTCRPVGTTLNRLIVVGDLVEW